VPPPPAKKVFLSYSHKDRGLVSPVGRLLRASNDAVFQDCDSIQPGARWQATIDEALAESDSMYVFWCRHASSSDEVRKEYVAAIARGVAVVPVLLDGTPLNQELSAFQGVDFREVAVHPRFSLAAKVAALVALGLPALAAGLLLSGAYMVSMGNVGAGLDEGGVVATLQLNPAAHTFGALGETIRLEVIARDQQGQEVPGFSARSPSWFPTVEDVVSVDDTGLVTAVGNGETDVVARVVRDDGVKIDQQARMTVRAPWWSVVAYWLRQNVVPNRIPLGVIAALVALVVWRWRRQHQKRAELASQILGDLQGRAASPPG
jgi:hypothetical protein